MVYYYKQNIYTTIDLYWLFHETSCDRHTNFHAD